MFASEGAESHPLHPGRPGATDRRAAAPHSCVLLGSSEVAPTVRLTSSTPASLRSFRQGGVHPIGRVTSSLAGGSRLHGQVQAPPAERAACSPAAVFLAVRPPSWGPAAHVRVRQGSPRPRAHPLQASPLLSEPGATESESPKANEGRRPRRSTICRGPQVTVRSGHFSAAHGPHFGGGPVSGRAPIPGLAETPSARPPSWETYRSGRGQRSRLGPCRHRCRRSLRGLGASGNN
ncbi:hypothetical protein NDU88_002185 [Pleurodeles waltl]|uniref:Uncharacterized protein n=1 Tax=Pleurodeles waltl TaxID=8319 RepID=A0AAV7SDL4_PLEWA|nr:hypothetical protein NDU88_002185 [Pleurodeles waltl]